MTGVSTICLLILICLSGKDEHSLHAPIRQIVRISLRKLPSERIKFHIVCFLGQIDMNRVPACELRNIENKQDAQNGVYYQNNLRKNHCLLILPVNLMRLSRTCYLTLSFCSCPCSWRTKVLRQKALHAQSACVADGWEPFTGSRTSQCLSNVEHDYLFHLLCHEKMNGD